MKKTSPATTARASATRADAQDPRPASRQFDTLKLLMAGETGKAVHFEFAAEQGRRVYVAGTFNNWDPTTHPLQHHPEDGVYRATLLLPPGTHEYKFVVDSLWHVDAKCPQWAPNAHGTLNSVIRV